MAPHVLLKRAPEALWLGVSPSFERLDRQLLGCLARQTAISHWGYHQTPDEPSSLDTALTLLHDFVKTQPRPLHLLGHGTGGLLGLLYARKYPQRVRSLTLLAVGANPAVDWQAHYYSQLERRPCCRTVVLTQMVHSLFGHQARPLLKAWLSLLEQDLMHSLSPHSLWRRINLGRGGVSMPLLVCGGIDDPVVDSVQLRGWQPWLKACDRIWQCPNGRHFFHASQPQQVAEQIHSFWAETETCGQPQGQLKHAS